jgi:hypothetical protein
MRGVLLGRLRSYERRGSARQTGLRPCDGKQHELTICEKTRREAEVRAHPGPSVWGSRPLRGNQEAPSQTGGYARCSAREAAFVRAPWVGPPNRASPMRGFVVALGTCGAMRERVGPGGQTGLRPCVGLWSGAGRVERHVCYGSGAGLVWRVAPRAALLDTASALQNPGCAQDRLHGDSRQRADTAPHWTGEPTTRYRRA